jgi:hypothetical protein
MAQVEVAGNVSLGDAVLQLHAGIQALLKQQRAMARIIERSRTQPNAADFGVSGICPASGALVFDLGGPALGYIWEVRRVSFFEADNPIAAVGGTGWLFTGTSMGPAAAGSSSLPTASLVGQQFVDKTGVNFPTSGLYDSAMVPLKYPEHVLVAITNGSSGVLYGVSGTAAQYPDPTQDVELVM